MAPVLAGPNFGSKAVPGYLNVPYVANGHWYATHA